ncbi:hypothetical protein EAH79_05130 [Sphingomonas koreensis]|nr:hypothetical protein EAH79_05130 [Sphingomonas koreensis]
MPAIAPIVGAVLLAGCHASVQPQNAAAPDAAQDNYQQQIGALSDPARAGVFLRAIRDAGFDCQKVVSATTHAPINGQPTWIARCQQGKPYVLELQAGGILNVTPVAAADVQDRV